MKKMTIDEIKKAFESEPIDWTNYEKLAQDVWLFLVPNKRLPQAVITKEAFLHEVKIMIENAVLFNKPKDSSHPEQGEQGEFYKWVKDAIESYVYKWPPEIQDAMRKDILFGYDLGYKEFLALIIESNEVLRSCYQVAERSGEKTNWQELRDKIKAVLEKQHKAIYMPNSKLSSPPPEGQDELWEEILSQLHPYFLKEDYQDFKGQFKQQYQLIKK